MPYNANVIKVMIASPSDVTVERNVIREVLSEWNVIHSDNRKLVLLPIGWETHTSPEMGEPPQAIINKQILKDCDLLVGVFWTRIGTATGDYASGTVEEIEEHIKSGKPAMLYFSAAPVVPDSIDATQYEALKVFKDSCKSRSLYETYADVNEFKDKFSRQLQLRVNQDSYFTEHSATTVDTASSASSVPDVPAVSREAQILLKEAVQDPAGRIFRVATGQGMIIQTNGKGFVEANNPRSSAIWEGALKELEQSGLIVERSGKVDPRFNNAAFYVSRKGYEVAGLLNP
jgi:hypothetical protein